MCSHFIATAEQDLSVLLQPEQVLEAWAVVNKRSALVITHTIIPSLGTKILDHYTVGKNKVPPPGSGEE